MTRSRLPAWITSAVTFVVLRTAARADLMDHVQQFIVGGAGFHADFDVGCRLQRRQARIGHGVGYQDSVFVVHSSLFSHALRGVDAHERKGFGQAQPGDAAEQQSAPLVPGRPHRRHGSHDKMR